MGKHIGGGKSVNKNMEVKFIARECIIICSIFSHPLSVMCQSLKTTSRIVVWHAFQVCTKEEDFIEQCCWQYFKRKINVPHYT